MRLLHTLAEGYGAMKMAGCLSWLSVGCTGAAGHVLMLSHSFRYQPDQNLNSCKKEKSESGAVEMELALEFSSSTEPVSAARTPGIARSLCIPTDTIPTLRSGQIVYRCASLLGECQDFPLGHLESDSMWGTSLAEGETQYRQIWWDVAQGPDMLLLPN